ncbi:hypothetical protein W03_00050 [Nitrosomonas sp. PY1]|uniref:phage holin family protein n=1 Tax=Nitrosomonas sp. PY1 TaxID=1803906 RepID=UPI001FC8C5B6|nr:phage holin family protein [Nitrosomonas sp. PY1]GKS68001.1 hypothetical protein W03_00050 [Nitrosomonas sp. PY1]
MLPKLLTETLAAETAKLWKGSVRLAIIMAFLGLSVMAMIVGVIFVLIGLYLSLAEIMPYWQAGAIVGGGVFLLAALLLIIISQQGGRSAPPKPPKNVNRLAAQVSPDDSTTQLGSVIGDIVAKSNVKKSDIVLTVLISGIILGASPSLRQQILNAISEITKSKDK